MRKYDATAGRTNGRARLMRIAPRVWGLCLLMAVSAVAESPAVAAAMEAEALRDSGWAAHADMVFRHLKSPEMRYTNAIAQDAEGFIWLATQSGLVRWDGYRSRVYSADAPDKTALPANRVLSLATDARGRLWVGTAGGGLARYDPLRDAFEAVDLSAAGELRNVSVSAIIADGDRGLWIGTGQGLDHLELATAAINRVALGGAHVAVEALLQDGDGTLWAGTAVGLMRRVSGSDHFSPVALEVVGTATPGVRTLRRDSRGNLWIGSDGSGAFVIEAGHSEARAVLETTAASPLGSESITAILEVQPGQIWLGTAHRGIVVVDTGSAWRTRRLRYNLDQSTNLEDENIRAMFRDRSGLVWVACTMAMNVHDPRQRGISTLVGGANGDRPISGVQVPFVLATPDGRAWLSIGDAGGVDILDPLAGRVAELRADPAHPLSALPVARVLSMAMAADGEVYIGTRTGLYKSDSKGRHVTRVAIPQRAADAATWSLCFDGQVLWIGGVDGLWATTATLAGPMALLRHETAERLGNQRVTAILRGRGDTLWVGTATDLIRVNVASGEVERLPTDTADPTAFLAGYVAALLIDGQQRLWVATSEVGIQILEGRHPDGRARFHRLRRRDGLPHDDVDQLLSDLQGNIWASTDNGLVVIDPATYSMRTLGAPQGLTILQYWTNSGARTAAGELLFGGQGGLTVVRPSLVSTSYYRPPVVVTEVHAGGSAVVSSSLNGLNSPKRLDIPSDDRSLMVEFAALDYTAPEENHYGYRLRGFDKDWIITQPTRRLASYTNLPPGDYTLQLRGSGPQAPSSPEMLNLPIRVLPAWYETAGFKLLAGTLALLAVAGVMQIRTALLRHRQKELEKLVADRTAELLQRSVELRESQQQLEQIAYLDPLTGIANRRLFDSELARLTAHALRGSANFTLLLVDLDHFKQINDTLGHDAGDALLIEVGRRLVATLRLSDRIFRIGGDEFAVLLPETYDPADIEAACSRIVENLRRPFAYLDQTLKPSTTVGAACWSATMAGFDALYKSADLALYEAKAAGRGTWCISQLGRVPQNA